MRSSLGWMLEQRSSSVGAPRKIAHAFLTMTPTPPNSIVQNAICRLTEFSQLTVRDQDMVGRAPSRWWS